MGRRKLQAPLLALPEHVLDSCDAIQMLYVSFESLDFELFVVVEFVAAEFFAYQEVVAAAGVDLLDVVVAPRFG